MLRSVALVLAVSVVAAGCGQMSKNGRAASVAGGLALATAGLFVAQPTAVDADHNGRNDWFLDDDFSGLIPGMLMVAGGIAMTIAGLSSSSADEETAPRTPAAAPNPVSVVVTAPPSLVEAQPMVAPLPELPVDEPTLRAGKQIRAAVAVGHCEHAWIMWRGLRDAQPVYAAALVDGPVLSPCRRN